MTTDQITIEVFVFNAGDTVLVGGTKNSVRGIKAQILWRYRGVSLESSRGMVNKYHVRLDPSRWNHETFFEEDMLLP